METLRFEHVRDAIPDVLEALRLLHPKPRLIRIDGVDGSGKTTLANMLGVRLDAFVLHGDDFVTRKNTGEAYPEIINKPGFQTEIVEGLSSGRWIIAESICLGEVVPESAVGRGFRLYLKRLSFNTPSLPFWHGFDDEGDVPEREIARSVHKYHLRYRPHEHADLVIEIPGCGHTLSGPNSFHD